MSNSLFPDDRFNTLQPNGDRLHDEMIQDMEDETNVDFIPKTSKELGSKMILHQFYPAWEAQIYIRMANISLHLHNAKYPTYEATGVLPQLCDGNFLVPAPDIISHLQTYHCDIDAHLSPREKSDSYTYRRMVVEDLYNVMLYARWVDPITYAEITRPHIKRHIPFPINLYAPKKVHSNMKTKLEQIGITTKAQVYTIARDAYTALNAKLCESNTVEKDKLHYFFGHTKPSALDAAVFGHFADALSDRLLSATVHKFAPQVVRLVQQMKTEYFGDEAKELTAQWSENEANYFVLKDKEHQFMYDANASSKTIPFLKPYVNLSWPMRQELESMITLSRKERRKQRLDSSSDLKEDQSFPVGKRNAIIGGLVVVGLYTLHTLRPLISEALDILEEMEDDFE